MTFIIIHEKLSCPCSHTVRLAVLYPPLTYLKPTPRGPEVVELTGRRLTVVEVVPTFGTLN